MKDSIKKFLEFNGKAIYFLAKDGQYWIALKPICEALGVDYNRQFQNLKNSEFFSQPFAQEQTVEHKTRGQLYAVQPMVGADDKVRQMVSLPERYIYFWIAKIDSSSPDLIKYQFECSNILYNHFHGAITGRRDVLRELARIERDEDELERAWPEAFKAQQRIDAKRRALKTQLRLQDQEIFNDQLNLFVTDRPLPPIAEELDREVSFQNIHSLIRKVRRDANLSQSHVADVLGVDYTTYNRYEKKGSKIKFEHVVKLAELYNMNLSEFLHSERLEKVKSITGLKSK